MDTKTVAVIVGLSHAAKPTADLVKDFLDRIFGPSLDAAGDVLAHPLREWQRKRVERAQQVITDAAILVEKSGKEPHQVPGRLLMPILEKASVEENPDLQGQWTALLANAAIDEPSVLAAFPQILASLAPLDAKVLQFLGRLSGESHSKLFIVANIGSRHLTVDHDSLLLEAQYQVRMENLHRMGLIYPVMIPIQQGYEGEKGIIIPTTGKVQYKNIGLTELGRAFISACTSQAVPSQSHEKT